MAHGAQHFSDGTAYERFMGRWTEAVGAIFLDWVAPPGSARWLDVGCGTGVFTQLVIDTCRPAAVVAIDPSQPQIELARKKPIAQKADFRVADAQALPFSAGEFDVVASALVINFIPDRPRSLAEMRRVCRAGGMVAAYIWDFAAERSPNSPIRAALSQIGIEPPPVPGAEDTRLEALNSLFVGVELADIATKVIEVTRSFPDFDEFWQSQMPSYGATSKTVAALSQGERDKVIALLRGRLRPGVDGSISYSACANAIKARVPE